MKLVVFESYLLYLVTRNYKATTLYKTCRKLFCLRIFNVFPHTRTGSLCKNTGQCT